VDDARLVLRLIHESIEFGGHALNYAQATAIDRNAEGNVKALIVEDIHSGAVRTLLTPLVINATGVFSDDLRKLDDLQSNPIIVPSQGVHLVLDKSFLPGDSAIMVPHTDDGRVLFAVPWHDRVIVGTTDTPIKNIQIEPLPLEEEINFLITHAARYLTKDPELKDVLSVFAGIRPLVKAAESKDTAALSRDHSIFISRSGLITIAGGKWTTYRKMAEDTVNEAAILAGLSPKPCITENLNLHGFRTPKESDNLLNIYGTDNSKMEKIFEESAEYKEKLHPALPYYKGEVIWAVRHEMAVTLMDVLSRRTRCLILDARKSMDISLEVAKLMTNELSKDDNWQQKEIQKFKSLAVMYSPKIL
jgi:glycerol-3-phosphate dehydrogenase